MPYNSRIWISLTTVLGLISLGAEGSYLLNKSKYYTHQYNAPTSSVTCDVIINKKYSIANLTFRPTENQNLLVNKYVYSYRIIITDNSGKRTELPGNTGIYVKEPLHSGWLLLQNNETLTLEIPLTDPYGTPIPPRLLNGGTLELATVQQEADTGGIPRVPQTRILIGQLGKWKVP